MLCVEVCVILWYIKKKVLMKKLWKLKIKIEKRKEFLKWKLEIKIK
jgi:hypothetical protein